MQDVIFGVFISHFLSFFSSSENSSNLSKFTSYCSFDELLELSQRGDNRTIDMLVGDIYGGMDYSKVLLHVKYHIILVFVLTHSCSYS